MLVPNIIAAPRPWKIRRMISSVSLNEKARSKEAIISIVIPYFKIFFLPYISAILPIGTRNIAAANRYDKETQLSRTRFIPKSIPMDGSPINNEEIMKGARKELIVVMINTIFLLTVLFMISLLHQKKVALYSRLTLDTILWLP